jgi:hypothetical protein
VVSPGLNINSKIGSTIHYQPASGPEEFSKTGGAILIGDFTVLAEGRTPGDHRSGVQQNAQLAGVFKFTNVKSQPASSGQ